MPADISYLYDLANWWKAGAEHLTPKIIKASQFNLKPGRVSITSQLENDDIPIQASEKAGWNKKGMCLIKDVEPGDFFDCVVEVRSPLTSFHALRYSFDLFAGNQRLVISNEDSPNGTHGDGLDKTFSASARSLSWTHLPTQDEDYRMGCPG